MIMEFVLSNWFIVLKKHNWELFKEWIGVVIIIIK